jgi:two-component system, LytTR family, response regulator
VRPDLLFLDVQMPGLDGFGVLEALGPAHMPVTIFTTAYDQFALRAFDAHAIDYVLKPYDTERFRNAIERARMHIWPAARADG